MSTKSTIKHRLVEPGWTGFHLYRDLVDEGDVVHLALTGVGFDASTDGGGTVDVVIPRSWAIELGLLPENTPPYVDETDGE